MSDQCGSQARIAMRFYVNLNYFLAGNESDKLRIRHFFKFSSLTQLFLLDYFPPFTSSQFRTLMVTTGCLWFFLFHSLFCWSFYYFINIISNDFWKKKRYYWRSRACPSVCSTVKKKFEWTQKVHKSSTLDLDLTHTKNRSSPILHTSTYKCFAFICKENNIFYAYQIQ